MADSWDENVGENDPNQPGHGEPSLSAAYEAGTAASVAQDIFHVYDSEDALTSDDEYHEARTNLREYGETRRRKVKARVVVDGEEVEQLEAFEEEDSDDDEEDSDDGEEEGYRAVNVEEVVEGPGNEEASHPNPQSPQQAGGEDSQHSSYRLSEDSLHVRGNLSDEEGGELYDDAPRYDPNCDHKTLQFVCRMKFDGASQFKEAVVKHAVAAGAGLRWVRSNPTRREVKCKDVNCKWKLYASWFRKDKCFMIRKVGLPHSCYRAKVEAIKLLSGSLVDENKRLRTYVAELMKRDREGRFMLEVEPHPDGDKCFFKRFYVGFSNLKNGFLEGCRPMFGLDGCFLKGEVKGMLLSAVGKDGNNQMFPIAWAVVEGENTDSWMWFVRILSEELGMLDGRRWTVISDQQKGLVEAIHQLLPEAEHRKCARHVYANWKAKNKTDQIRKLFWTAVYASNIVAWRKATSQMESIEGNGDGPTPYKDFMDAEPKRFCRAFLSTIPKCDSVESNICETWNGSIVKYRGLRIIDMLEGIRGYMMERVAIKYKMLVDTTDLLCPRIRKRLEKEKEYARYCVPRHALNDKCEVKIGSEGFIVNLNTRECTCGYWQLSGLPCCHAVSAISHLRKEPADYVHPVYHAYHVSFAYKVGMPCVDGRQAWPEASGFDVYPPKQRAMPGRPKKNRRKAAVELETRAQRGGIGEEVTRRGSLIRCTKCQGEGHNARACPVFVSAH